MADSSQSPIQEERGVKITFHMIQQPAVVPLVYKKVVVDTELEESSACELSPQSVVATPTVGA